MFFKSLLITSLLVIYSVNFSEAIQCYVCSSLIDQACGTDKFEAKDGWKRNCDIEPKPGSLPNPVSKVTKCSLLVQKDQNGKNITNRGCHWETTGVPSKCYKDNVLDAYVVECNSCDTDLCNSAAKIFSTIGGTFLMMIVVGFFLS